MFTLLKAIVPYCFLALSGIFLVQCLNGKPKWTLFFLIFLLPLRNVIEQIQTLPLGKDFTDYLFIFLCFGWLIYKTKTKQPLFTPSTLNFIIILHVFYTLFTLILGYSFLHGYTQFYIDDDRIVLWKNYIMLPMLFFITLNTIETNKDILILIGLICFSMICMDYYTVRQIFWYNNILARSKINSTFFYLGPNEVAAFYTQYTILLIGLVFHLKKRIPQTILMVLIGFNIFCILFIYSRAAYIAFAVGLIIFCFWRNKILLIPLAIILISWQTFLPKNVQSRILMTTNQYGQLDESSENRITLWESSWGIFLKNPIFGSGFGVFKFLGFQLKDTHNLYLKILLEQGVIGLIIFLILILKMLGSGIRLYYQKTDPALKGLGVGLTCCIITLMINNFFGDRWTYTEVSSNLWVFAALVAKLIQINSQYKSENNP